MQSIHKRIVAFVLLSLLLVSAIAAPLKENKVNDGQDEETQKIDSALTLQNDGDGETQAKHVEEAIQGADTEPNDEGDDDRGQEVINYQDIQVDHNSKVTSENEGEKQETENTEDDDDDNFEETPFDEEEDGYEDEDEDEGDVDEEDDFQYMLTPAAARELMLELRDPVEVAKFVVETDDAAGFLRALRLLLHDGYITEAQAYSLKDEVASQLRNLLMLQQVELSRALFETYQPQLEDEDTNAALEGLLFDTEPQQMDYYDYANLVNQDDPTYGSSQGNLYDAYQEALEEESSQALAQIAEVLAQRIAKGEISSEEGAKIMSTVVQLLPETYWGDNEETMSSDPMTSQYMIDGESVDMSSQISELDDDEENQDKEDDGDYSDEDETEPLIKENFEEELMQAGPDGLVKDIKEEDHNGNDDAAELEEEAENLAEELQDELREEGQAGNGEAVKIERPGAKAEIKVGPSNDVIDDQVRQDWKDMSLLLDKNIPESVLRSLGISFDEPALEKEIEAILPEEESD